MILTPEEKELLKQRTLAIAEKIHEEIVERISKGELKVEKMSLKMLLEQFQSFVNVVKQQQPKLAISVPISFDRDKMRKVENLYSDNGRRLT